DDLVNRDLLSGRSQFMLLPYKYGEDSGIKMNIPNKAGDGKGVVQLTDDKKDSSSFAKRFLENLALPQMYLI
ncbi:MAG: hypothetical protein JST89_26525, partial [Cyanobacteria bacterium SZAS-4]|nr:hypothetical protein [Cyanobacteria bacterium SZAS-4]